jgi:lysophospholipase L1-like esterase
MISHSAIKKEIERDNMQSFNDLRRAWKRQKKNEIRIICFGASNTELSWHSLGHHNWVSWLDCALREWVGRHLTVINQGISAETAEDLLIRIDRDVISYSPTAVIVTVAGNDAMRGHSLDRYRKNMTEIIERIQAVDSIPILQTYYCPFYKDISVEDFKQFPKFVDVNRALASEKELLLLDQYKYFYPFYENDRENYRKIMLDGLHVNPIGNTLMGIIACRLFCLPDPKILDESHEQTVTKFLTLMKKYADLPPQRTRSGAIAADGASKPHKGRYI